MQSFERAWHDMHLGDDELRKVQDILINDPKAGVVIQDTGGLRKLRIAFRGRGKSGSGRIIYIDFAIYEKIYLFFAYPKNEMENISAEKKKLLKTQVSILEKELSGRRK